MAAASSKAIVSIAGGLCLVAGALAVYVFVSPDNETATTADNGFVEAQASSEVSMSDQVAPASTLQPNSDPAVDSETTTSVAADTATAKPRVADANLDIQPVSFWEAKFNLSTAQSVCDGKIDELKANSHGMYRSAYSCFDGLVAMWRATGDTKYLDVAIDHVEKGIALAKPGQGQFNDSYLGWEAQRAGEEFSLTDIYFYRYVTVMLREMNERPELLATGNYQQKYDTILEFTETNIYEKWRTRTGYSDVFRSRTHIVSHWGHICMNLSMISKSAETRADCSDIVSKINNGMPELGGAGLRSQLVPWPKVPGALHWTNQWNETPESLGWPTDVNHGGAEVGYIAEAFDYGIDFTQAEVDGILTLTNEHILPTGNSSPPPWISADANFCPEDYRTTSACPTQGGLFSEGFTKLARYNQTLQKKLEQYSSPNQQLIGNAALSAAILNGNDV